jgi:hypothetical protein
MDGKPRHYILLVEILFLLLVVPPFVKYAWWETRDYVGGDFQVFYRAAQKVAAGESPYPAEVLKGDTEGGAARAWGNYIYPPFFAWMLEPLTVLAPYPAKKVYLLLCLFLYLGLFYRPRKNLPPEEIQRWLRLAILLGWGPVILNFRQGQSNFVPLFLAFMAWEGCRRRPSSPGWEWISGILLGIGSMVKLTPLLMLPPLVVAQRWRSAAGFVLGAVGALLISGPAASWDYFTKVLPTLGNFSGMRWCPSIHIVAIRVLDTLPVPASWEGTWPHIAEKSGVLISGGLYLGLLALLFLRRTRMKTADLILLACFLPPLFAGEADHHYALAVLPLLEGVRRMAARGAWGRLALLALAISPAFFYWGVVKAVYALILPINTSFLLVLGNSLALVLMAPDFFKQSQKPPQAESPLL